MATSRPITFSNLCRRTETFWNEHFQRLSRLNESGKLVTRGVTDPVPFYPTLVLATELPDHYAIELLGGRRRLQPMKVKKHRLADTDCYLGQFTRSSTGNAMIEVASTHNGFKNLCLMPQLDEQAIEKRFPGVTATFPTKLVLVGDPDVMPFRFAPESNFTQLENCLLVNSFEGAIRIRHIWTTLFVNKETTELEYMEYLRTEFRLVDGQEPPAWKVVSAGEAESVFHAAQFCNAYLLNKLRETTLGMYLEQNQDILLRAFQATQILSEPYLPWQVASPDPQEEAINPDLFVQRKEDGYWDVYDLKLPFLESRSITQGARRRRRFVSSVEEGVAQLAHYREFLDIPENRELARKKYGVEFENPRFGLVAGTMENFNTTEVKEALRRYPEFTVLDYDSIAQLYLAAER